jgi:hypothetical protein
MTVVVGGHMLLLTRVCNAVRLHARDRLRFGSSRAVSRALSQASHRLRYEDVLDGHTRPLTGALGSLAGYWSIPDDVEMTFLDWTHIRARQMTKNGRQGWRWNTQRQLQL